MKSDPLEPHQTMEQRTNSADVAFNNSSTSNFSSCVLNPPCNRTAINKPVNGTDLANNSTAQGGELGLQSSGAAQTNMAILISLIVLIALLLLILTYLIGPPILWFVKRRIPVDPKKVDARYETIEGWLISKRVRAHDDSCPCTKFSEKNASPSVTPDLKHSSTYDTVDVRFDNTNEDDSDTSRDVECPICMSSMHAGEIVSYNFSSSCSTHVFHHGCIKEWLLRHASCPTCRQTYMPIDNPFPTAHRQKSHPFTKSRHRQLTEERAMWGSRTFVCEKSGLVVLSNCPTSTDLETPPSAADNDVLSTTIDWIHRSCPIVKRADLINLRGTKSDEAKTVSVDDDGGGGLVEVPFAG